MADISIVFDGPPSHESGRFVEVEQDGKSIRCGEWRAREDGLWELRFPDFAEQAAALRRELEVSTETNARLIQDADDLAKRRYMETKKASECIADLRRRLRERDETNATLPRWVAEGESKVADLERQLAEARKDGERLAAIYRLACPEEFNGIVLQLHGTSYCILSLRGTEIGFGTTFNDAVDAAMAEEAKP